MISQIYEKFIEYSNEYPNSIVWMKYSDLRDRIQSGWIYDNLDEFVTMWNEVEIFCRPSRSSARQEIPEDMDCAFIHDDTEFRVTRLTADQYPTINVFHGRELYQGDDNTYGCSYNSYGGNVHMRELKPYSLGDDEYPTSIINLSQELNNGFQQVSFVDSNEMEEGYQRQVSFVDSNEMEEGFQRQVSFVDNLLEDNNDMEEGFQRQVSFVDNLLEDNNDMEEGYQRQVSFIENLLGDQTEMSMSELDLGSDDEDDEEMPELMDL